MADTRNITEEERLEEERIEALIQRHEEEASTEYYYALQFGNEQ